MSFSLEEVQKHAQSLAVSSCVWLCALFSVGTITSGCSVYMAAKQPAKKNLTVLKPGTPRSSVLAELGAPRSSRLVDLLRKDWFVFTQGYSKEARAGRAFAHGTLDIATSGLWELAGTPTEALLNGKKMSFEVTYDHLDRVLSVARVHVAD
jgi:hypothetical protein